MINLSLEKVEVEELKKVVAKEVEAAYEQFNECLAKIELCEANADKASAEWWDKEASYYGNKHSVLVELDHKLREALK